MVREVGTSIQGQACPAPGPSSTHASPAFPRQLGHRRQLEANPSPQMAQRHAYRRHPRPPSGLRCTRRSRLVQPMPCSPRALHIGANPFAHHAQPAGCQGASRGQRGDRESPCGGPRGPCARLAFGYPAHSSCRVDITSIPPQCAVLWQRKPGCLLAYHLRTGNQRRGLLLGRKLAGPYACRPLRPPRTQHVQMPASAIARHYISASLSTLVAELSLEAGSFMLNAGSTCVARARSRRRGRLLGPWNVTLARRQPCHLIRTSSSLLLFSRACPMMCANPNELGATVSRGSQQLREARFRAAPALVGFGCGPRVFPRAVRISRAASPRRHIIAAPTVREHRPPTRAACPKRSLKLVHATPPRPGRHRARASAHWHTGTRSRCSR